MQSSDDTRLNKMIHLFEQNIYNKSQYYPFLSMDDIQENYSIRKTFQHIDESYLMIKLFFFNICNW